MRPRHAQAHGDSMSMSTTSPYLLGHNDAELRRLQEQAGVLAPATASFLTLAGIGRGMRVLDLGTGVGDVAFLAANRVGPSGAVVGIDNSATAIHTARRRADRDRVGNVSFLEADVATVDPAIELGGQFDAVIGRLILLYLDDATEVIRRYARSVRPGGVLLAMEYDMTSATTLPPVPLSTQALDWIIGAFEWTGHDPALGARLGGIVADAGLIGSVCLGAQTYLAPQDPAGPRLLASAVRTLLPAICGARIASAEEVGIDTLEQRLSVVQAEANAIVKPPTLVGAWGRTAA